MATVELCAIKNKHYSVEPGVSLKITNGFRVGHEGQFGPKRNNMVRAVDDGQAVLMFHCF